MARSSNREKLLCEGLRLVHERGFGAASVRDIVQAAGVPQGSFTNHFVSKEAFGLEVLARYRAANATLLAETLGNEALPPLARLRGWFDAQIDHLKQEHLRKGCLCGNLGAETSEQSEPIRLGVAAAFDEDTASVSRCLAAAVANGDLPSTTDVEALAGFLVSSFQGAVLVAKSQRSPLPLDRFVAIAFGQLLHA